MSAADHVDLVEVDWSRGIQHRVAQVALDGEGKFLVSRCRDESYWYELLAKPIPDFKRGGTLIDPAAEPRKYLERMHMAYDGSQFYASSFHGARECPFGDAAVLRLNPSELSLPNA